MLSNRLKGRKNTESKNPNIARTKNGRIMLLSKCLVCNSKKWKLLKEEESRRLWDNFNMKEMVGMNWIRKIVYE